MHCPFIPSILVLAAAVATALGAPGEFRPSETSAGATWFAHLNLVSLRSSELGQQLIGELDGEAKRQLRQIERMLNFHPINDLESATVYGTSSDPEKAVALLRGRFDIDRLTGVAKDCDGYQAASHGAVTIHSWMDGGKRIYASIASPGLIIIGPEVDLIRTALDVISGAAEPLDESKIFGHSPTTHAPVVIASADLSALGSLEIDSSLVRKIKAIYVSAGEQDGELLAYAALRTADARSAKLVDQMLHGVLALAEASDEVPPEVIEAFQTKLSDSGISLTVSLPIKKFKDLVAKLEKAADGLK